MYRSRREMEKPKNVTRKWEMCSSFSLEGGDDDHDHDVQYSWPPKSYTCTFCKRDFKSAQALGGHMNVHRRERARLRLYQPMPAPSWVVSHQFYSPKPKYLSPNLGFSSSSSSMSWEKRRIVHGVADHLVKGKKMMISGSGDDDLEMEKGFKDQKEVLDLELRLGCF